MMLTIGMLVHLCLWFSIAFSGTEGKLFVNQKSENCPNGIVYREGCRLCYCIEKDNIPVTNKCESKYYDDAECAAVSLKAHCVAENLLYDYKKECEGECSCNEAKNVTICENLPCDNALLSFLGYYDESGKPNRSRIVRHRTNRKPMRRDVSVTELINNTDNNDPTNKDETPEDITTASTPEDSATTHTPEESATTTTPEDGATTNTPEDGAATTTPEDSDTTNTPEDSATTNTPEDGATTNTPEDSATTNTPEDSATTNKPEDGAEIEEHDATEEPDIEDDYASTKTTTTGGNGNNCGCSNKKSKEHHNTCDQGDKPVTTPAGGVQFARNRRTNGCPHGMFYRKGCLVCYCLPETSFCELVVPYEQCNKYARKVHCHGVKFVYGYSKKCEGKCECKTCKDPLQRITTCERLPCHNQVLLYYGVLGRSTTWGVTPSGRVEGVLIAA